MNQFEKLQGSTRTLEELAAVRLTGRDLQRDDVALGLVQKLDGDSYGRRHVCDAQKGLGGKVGGGPGEFGRA